MAQKLQREVCLGKQGRMVIPASLRQALGLKPRDRLIAREEDGRLVIEKRQQVLGRVKARFAAVPSGVSLADELISDRRVEARRDELP